MFFSKFALVLSLATVSLSAPIQQKRADLLTAQDYADFQVSDGVAGNALAEVEEKFSV